MKKLKFYFLIFLVINLACEQEETISPDEGIHDIATSSSKVIFLSADTELQNSVKKLSNKVIETNKGASMLDDVDFDRALKRYDAALKITYYTFSMKPDELTTRKFVLRQSDNGNILGHAFEFEVDADWLNEQEVFPGWHQYTGWLRILELDGNVLSENRVENGQVAGTKNGKQQASRSGPVCERTYTNWYSCSRFASDPNWHCESEPYRTTVSTECTWESMSHDGMLPGGGHNKVGLESIDFSEWEQTQLNAVEDNVINNLTGVPLCVYNKLKSLNGNLFKKTIGAFIDDPQYDLTLRTGECVRTDEACTDGTDPKNIIITIENVNQSSLGLASLILHEGLHAEMHRYVSRYESGVDPNNRARLLQLYAWYKKWALKYQDKDYNWKNDAHHAYMVENYVKKVASALRQLDGNQFALDYYMSYAWDGLRDSGYAAKKLSKEKNTYYDNLRRTTEANSEICK
ncbi:hypothetical protein [Allomuricauda sp. d1]|uniref:hypothetical protein n=1 Tax=Allomuricauda sp. d1 TaxID=3136725 RepID=UPI0031D103E0